MREVLGSSPGRAMCFFLPCDILESRSLSELTRQIAPPTKNGHAFSSPVTQAHERAMCNENVVISLTCKNWNDFWPRINTFIFELACMKVFFPSWNMTSIQRRLNVDATSWRCIDVEAMLYRRHVSAGFPLKWSRPVLHYLTRSKMWHQKWLK